MRLAWYALPLLLLTAACSSSPQDVYSGGATGTNLPDDTAAAEDGVYGEGFEDPATTSSELDPFAQEGAADGAEQPGSQQDFEVNVGDRVYFGYDSTSLDEAAQATLDRQAAWLLQYPETTVTLEGHTDERGTNDYNLALGERRAAAVKNYLVALGVDPGRLLPLSYGEERPVDPARDEQAYAQNRRVVTSVNLIN